MASDIPTRHWYQNDPGVVPNLLQTGAGSPTGITVYEGDLLPAIFRNQVVFCDAGSFSCNPGLFFFDAGSFSCDAGLFCFEGGSDGGEAEED